MLPLFTVVRVGFLPVGLLLFISVDAFCADPKVQVPGPDTLHSFLHKRFVPPPLCLSYVATNEVFDQLAHSRSALFTSPELEKVEWAREFLRQLAPWDFGQRPLDETVSAYFTIQRTEFFGEVEIQLFPAWVNVIIENPDMDVHQPLSEEEILRFPLRSASHRSENSRPLMVRYKYVEKALERANRAAPGMNLTPAVNLYAKTETTNSRILIQHLPLNLGTTVFLREFLAMRDGRFPDGETNESMGLDGLLSRGGNVR